MATRARALGSYLRCAPGLAWGLGARIFVRGSWGRCAVLGVVSKVSSFERAWLHEQERWGPRALRSYLRCAPGWLGGLGARIFWELGGGTGGVSCLKPGTRMFQVMEAARICS